MNKPSFGIEGHEVHPLRSASLSSANVASRVLMTPWGSVESTNGSFVVDEESATLVIASFAEHGTDLPIDYEHQTLGGSYASPSGKAPAAGWIKRIEVDPGVGIVATIEWTDEAKRMLGAKEYRYLSPVAIIRKTDRKLVAIHSAALTNKPAIVGMNPIVNSVTLDVDTDDCLCELREQLSLSRDANAREVLVAVGQRLADLGKEATNRHVEDRIREALADGKLVEAQRAWAEALVAKEEGLFDEWLRTAPVIVRPGRTNPPVTAGSDGRRNVALVAKARAEYASNPLLSSMTSEDAFIADAVREARAQRNGLCR